MTTVVLVSGAVFLYALASAKLRATPLTPPMLFVAGGLLLGSSGVGLVHLDVRNEALRTLAEATLVVVVFSDAARMDLRTIVRERNLPLRLLGLGIPLAIGFGALAAHLLFPALPLADAAIIAAVLAPTDAALGQAVVTDSRVPARIRQTLNVESGLNDGLSVPFITLFLDIASHQAGTPLAYVGLFLEQVLIGAAVGALAGWFGGRLVQTSIDRGWASEASQRIAAVAIAFVAYAGASVLHGNGFIAAFAAGLALGTSARRAMPRVHTFSEAEGDLLAVLTFLIFGAVIVGGALGDASWRVVGYAAVSLALVRPLAVGISLLGSGLRPVTTAFVGWFGPRGLASIVFGLLVLETSGVPRRGTVFAVVTWTVVLSVFLHGATASPLAGRYGRAVGAGGRGAEHEPVDELPVRVPTADTGGHHSVTDGEGGPTTSPDPRGSRRT